MGTRMVNVKRRGVPLRVFLMESFFTSYRCCLVYDTVWYQEMVFGAATKRNIITCRAQTRVKKK